MNTMNKLKSFINRVAPMLLGSMWAFTIIIMSFAAFAFSIKLFLHLIGV